MIAVPRRHFLCFIIGLCLVSGAPARSAEVQVRIDEALTELQQGRLGEGARRLEDLLSDASLAEPGERARLYLVLSQVDGNLGRYVEGLEAAREALAIYESLDDRGGLAEAHFRVGAASDELAAYDDSHRHYQIALDLYRELGNRPGEARALSAFGTSYRFLGDPAAALTHYDAARELFAELDERPSLCWAFRHLGRVLEDLGRTQEAEAQYRRALELLGDWDRGWARSDLMFHLGRLLGRGADRSGALALLEEGLALARTSQNRWAEARQLVELARLHDSAGEPRLALPLVREGLGLLESMGAQDLEWEARSVYASLLEATGQEEAAHAEYVRALETLERIRSSIGLPLLRSRYIPRARGVYEGLLQLQFRWPPDMPSGERAERMFAIAERNRARAFAEMLIESRMAPSPGAPELRQRERTLRGEINALRTTLTRFGNTASDRTALERVLAEAEREHRSLLLKLRRDDPRYREGGETFTLRDGLAALPAGANLLAYHLGERGSFCWHVNRKGLALFELPPRRRIENQVLILRSLIVHRNDPAMLRAVSGGLFRTLVEPALERIDPAQPLIVVPDGTLFHLPFEALIRPAEDGSGTARYLIEDHRVHYVPSLAVLAQLIERDTDRDGAVEHDLVAFGNAGRAGDSAPRLDHAESEARGIASFFPRSRVALRVGPAAGESAFLELAPHPARVLHLAAHGNLHGVDPSRSGLLLDSPGDDGADGFLSLFEILNLRLGAQLVVLSSCETAGGELLRGEGVLGLTRAFLFSGAQTVVASMWRVDDRSTERLMLSFYGHLERGLSVAEALRRAKLEWIGEKGGAADPFPWAGFVVIGNGEMTLPLHRRSTALGALALGSGIILVTLGLFAALRSRS